jgi:hypothetical protein
MNSKCTWCYRVMAGCLAGIITDYPNYFAEIGK